MTKFWVSFAKYAGVVVDADTEEQAEALALEVPEEEYEYSQTSDEDWGIISVVDIEDD